MYHTPSGSSRRAGFRGAGWLLGAALLAGACAPAAPPAAPAAPVQPAAPASPAQPAPAAPAVPQPERGGTFQLAAAQGVDHMSYWKDGGVRASIGLTPVYEPLVALDYKPQEDWRENYRVVPNLAERWEQPNPTTYVFSLRPGIKWHDGVDLTAQDVEWAYKSILDPKNAFRGSSNLRETDVIAATDQRTVRVTIKQPSATFLIQLADRNSVIQPRHIVERGQKHEDVAVGTGPYKVASFDRQKGLELVRNDGYWQGGGKPYLDKVKIVWGLDVSGMTAAFQAKQNDVLKVTDKVQFDTLKRLSPQMGSQVFLRDIIDWVYMRVDRPPFSDVRVRQAVHLGIDRPQMVEALTFGLGIANPPAVNGGRKGWVISQEELKALPGWRQPKDPDLAEAKRLLGEAGFGQGLKFTTKYFPTHSVSSKEAEVAAQQLKRIGVEMELQPTEVGIFQKAFKEGEFETAIESAVQYAPERDWNNYLHSKGAGNSFGIKDAEIDRLVEAQAGELDVAKRQQLFLAIQRLMLEKMYTIPLITHVGFTLWQPYVHGWIDNYAGQAANQVWDQLWVNVKDVPKDR